MEGEHWPPYLFSGTKRTPVEVLVDKLISHGSHQQRREKLLKALDDASQHYNTSTEKERKAFFHGLLTGYGVALKL